MLCKHGAYTLFTCEYTLYSGSCGRSQMCHFVESFVVHSPNIGIEVGSGYEGGGSSVLNPF
jgi:hypothetical protein